jgi:hypothetical protein
MAYLTADCGCEPGGVGGAIDFVLKLGLKGLLGLHGVWDSLGLWLSLGLHIHH